MKNLNLGKAHGWDNISIRMIKLCGKSIALPLSLIFQSILNDGVFPDDWKKSNVPCHKKDSKNLIKNFRQISVLPIFSKVFERSTYNSLYNYFIQNSASLVLCPVIHVSHSYYQSLTNFTKASIIIYPLM